MSTSTSRVFRIDVLLQLVMQCCDQPTRFALARCSRGTRKAASHPFAWRFLPPIRVELGAMKHIDVVSMKQSMCRFATTNVRANPYDTLGLSVDRQDALWALVPFLPMIDELSSGGNIPWCRIFTKYAMEFAHIRRMTLASSSFTESNDTIPFPDSLESLTLMGSFAAGELASLPLLRNLTSLEMRHILVGERTSSGHVYDAVAQCDQLRVLRITIGDNVPLDDFLSSRMVHLRELTLITSGTWSNGVPLETSTPGCGIFSLPQLHTLEILECACIRGWVDYVERAFPCSPNCSSIREIVLEPVLWMSMPSQQFPSANTMRRLSARCPLVHFDLAVPVITETTGTYIAVQKRRTPLRMYGRELIPTITRLQVEKATLEGLM